MASIVKEYKVKWAPYSATAPTTWNYLDDCIRSLPNFFSDPETVDSTCVTHGMKHSIPGLSGGEAYAIKVAVSKEFLEAHQQMVTEQSDEAKGSFWMEIELTNRGKKVTGRFTTVTQLPTPEAEAGALDEITWNVYPSSDIETTNI